MRLDQNAEFRPSGHVSRACGDCWRDWEEFERRVRFEGLEGLAGVESGRSDAKPILKPMAKTDEFLAGGMAQSEGRMEWSTF